MLHAPTCFRRFAVILTATIALVSAAVPARADVPTSPTLAPVHFRAIGALQARVWIDEEPAGTTPFTIELAPGRYQLAAVAEGVEPVVEPYDITGEPGQVAVLPMVPLSAANFPRVRAQLDAALGHYPERPDLISMALFLTRDLDEREAMIARLERTAPRDPFTLAFRARLLMDRGEDDAAIEMARRAVQIDGSLAFARRTLATALAQAGHFDEALDAANQAVLLEPNAWRNLRVRAVVYSRMGDDRAANHDVARANELYDQFQARAAEGR